MSLFRRAAQPEKRVGSLAATLKVVGKDTRAGGHPDMDSGSAQRVGAVWGCVRLIADTVATMPWDAVRVAKDARVPVDSLFLKSPDGGSAIAWKRRVVWSMVLRGNAYGLVTETTPDMRYPTRVVPLHPDDVSWRPVNGVLKPHIGSVRHDLWPLGDLWHLPAYEVPGSPVGMNPIEYAESVIGTAEKAQDFGEDFFEADAHPSAVVTSKNNIDAAQAAEIKTAAKNAIKDRDLLVISDDLTWKQIQVSPTDSQFLDTQRFSAQQICGAIFGVPPELLGYATSGQSVTYANAADRDLQFLKYGLSPWLVRIEEAMSRLLPGAQTVKFNAGSLLRTDLTSRFAAYKTAAEVGSLAGYSLMTVDEMRALEDMPPLDTLPNGGAAPRNVNPTPQKGATP